MKKMKRAAAWILGLALLLNLWAAAGESAFPEVPVFEGTLKTRPVSTPEEAVAYAREVWALDYLGMDMTGAEYTVNDWEDGLWHVLAHLDETFLDLAFDPEGNVLYLENIASGWTDVAPAFGDEEEEAAGELSEEEEAALQQRRQAVDRQLEYPFLKTVNPDVYEEYTALYPIREGSHTEFLTHYFGTQNTDLDGGAASFNLDYSEFYKDEQYRIKIGVQTMPVVRIVFFDVLCDAAEGGNG